MSPAIPRGSLIITKKQNNYFVGDIITFQHDKYKEGTTTHRIYNILNDNGQKLFVTKGDVNDALDSSIISSTQIIGKPIVFIPFYGTIVMAAKSDSGKIFIILIPVIIIISVETKKIINEINKAKKNNN